MAPDTCHIAVPKSTLLYTDVKQSFIFSKRMPNTWVLEYLLCEHPNKWITPCQWINKTEGITCPSPPNMTWCYTQLPSFLQNDAITIAWRTRTRLVTWDEVPSGLNPKGLEGLSNFLPLASFLCLSTKERGPFLWVFWPDSEPLTLQHNGVLWGPEQ